MHNQVCLICGVVTPEIKNKNLIARYGKYRKYCSNKCIKTAYRKNHPIKDKEAKARWVKENPEKRKEASASYMKRNRPYYANYASLRCRHLKQAQPKWANKQDILDVYTEAEYFQLEVDHIIPLKNPLVCGLHVWENLQLLSRKDNARKNNKFQIS